MASATRTPTTAARTTSAACWKPASRAANPSPPASQHRVSAKPSTVLPPNWRDPSKARWFVPNGPRQPRTGANPSSLNGRHRRRSPLSGAHHECLGRLRHRSIRALADCNKESGEYRCHTHQYRWQIGVSTNMPIIAQTANSFSEDREKCFAAGMVGYIAKPIDPEALANLVLQQVMARRNG